MPEQEVQHPGIGILKSDAVFKTNRNIITITITVGLCLFFLLLSLGFAFENQDNLDVALVCFAISFGGFLSLFFLYLGFLGLQTKCVVIGTEGVRYKRNWPPFTNRISEIRWEDVTGIHSSQYTELPGYMVLSYLKMLVIESSSGEFVFSNAQFSSGTLISMFRIMADKKNEYPQIEIVDECSWLNIPE